jgi:hemerythrin
MEAFVWDQNFVTGIPHVDRQHQELINRFDELSKAFLEDSAQEQVRLPLAFASMVEYAQLHFGEEEALMLAERVDPRHVQMHQKLHRQFLEQVQRMWATRSSMREPSEQFVGFLTSWLGLHILGIDQDLARQIARIRQGQTAELAYALEKDHHDNSTRALLKMVGRLFHTLSTQNAELAQVNFNLEERVHQRTRDLESANDALTRANRQLEVFARTDGLLHIANRKYFDERLLEECSRAYRTHQPLGLVMIDVDFFKRYNDRYGHLAGDQCLQSVASAVSSALMRAGDLLARYGGEELALILPDTTSEGTHVTAQRVLEAVRALRLEHADSAAAPHVTVSLGAVCSVPTSRDAGVQMLALADKALYQAKDSGRNRVCMADTWPAAKLSDVH